MICRACLLTSDSKSGLMKNLSEYIHHGLLYTELYEHCVGINILSEENHHLDLPIFICEPCEANLIKLFDFRQKCWASENILKYSNFKQENMVNEEESDDESDNSPYSDNDENNTTQQEYDMDPATPEDYSTISVDDNHEGTEEISEVSITLPKNRSNSIRKAPPIKICPICGKGIKNKFEYHVASHEDIPYEERPFSCSLCDKRFRHREYLRGHMNTHTKEQRYPCPFCDRKFQAWIGRKMHVAKYHTGEYRYECTACMERFWTKHQYNYHLTRKCGKSSIAEKNSD